LHDWAKWGTVGGMDFAAERQLAGKDGDLGRENAHNARQQRPFWLLPEERAAIHQRYFFP